MGNGGGGQGVSAEGVVAKLKAVADEHGKRAAESFNEDLVYKTLLVQVTPPLPPCQGPPSQEER